MSLLAGRSSSYAPMNTSDDESDSIHAEVEDEVVMEGGKEDPPDTDGDSEEEEDYTEEDENTEEFQSARREEFKEEVDVEDPVYPVSTSSPYSVDQVYSESTSPPYSVATTTRSTPRDVSFQAPEESFQQPHTPPATARKDSAKTPPLPPAIINRSAVKSKSKNDGEAPEDAFLSSPIGLAGLGCLIGLLLAGIAVGVALGVTKPWEPAETPKSVPSPSPTALGDTLSPTSFPTRAPIPLSLADEELLELFASVVGDIVYAPQTPHYEAGQWMLYGDPQRTGRRYLQDNTNDYDSESLDYIQRYLLVLLWYGTTDLGRNPWLSCNPPPPMPTQIEGCLYQKPVGKLTNGVISYTAIPWTRWLTGADECEWAGVSCETVEGRLSVTSIELGKC